MTEQELLFQVISYEPDTDSPELAYEAYLTAKRQLHQGNTL